MVGNERQRRFGIAALALAVALVVAACGSESGSGNPGGSSGGTGGTSAGGNGAAGSVSGSAGSSKGGAGGAGGTGGSGTSGSSGAGGNNDCQDIKLEVGQTDAQGVTLLHTQRSTSNVHGLGFVGDYLYFMAATDLTDNKLARISLTSDVVEVLDEDLLVDTLLLGDDLIWYAHDLSDTAKGTLQTAKLATPSQATVIATTGVVQDFVADAENVYYRKASPYELYKVARAGGVPERIAENALIDAMIVANGYLYFFDQTANALRRIPTAGGEAENVSDIGSPSSPVANAEGLFWSESFNREIRYLPFEATVSSVFIGDLKDSASRLTLNGADLLWTHSSPCHGVFRRNTGGTTVARIAGGFDIITWLGVQGDRLYVADQQALYRLDL